MPVYPNLIPAQATDRAGACRILAAAFDQNPSVNDTVKADQHRAKRVLALMEYGFDTGLRRGGVYLSADRKGVAIAFCPQQFPNRRADYASQLRLIHRAVSWTRLPHLLRKDKTLKSFHPKEHFLYLFFIGVDPAEHGKGIAGKMIAGLQEKARAEKLPLVLETSVPSNVVFYSKRGFKSFHRWTIREDYVIDFMRWDP